ncbi:hypothetical protein ABEF95_016793 [Exophiala dermatitidis]
MAKVKETARPSNLSEERVQDSSDEEPSSVTKSTPRQKPQAKVSKKPKQKSPTPESEEGSTDASSDSDTSDESEDESDSSSTSSQQKRTATSIMESPKKKPKTAPTSAAVQIAPKAFKPPQGYEPVAVSASDYASEVGTLFDDLSSKQIWHISIPDSVSIDSIRELDIKAATAGEPVLSKDGVNYNLKSMESKDEVVFLPQGKTMRYQQHAKRVEQSFVLQEMSDAQKSKKDASSIFTATDTGKPKPVRQQPDGLKMRYVPYGAPALPESPEIEDEDIEMKDTLDLPAELEPTSSQSTTKKSKHSSQDAVNGKTPEKKKKKKDVQDANEQASPEKKKKKRRHLVDENVL